MKYNKSRWHSRSALSIWRSREEARCWGLARELGVSKSVLGYWLKTKDSPVGEVLCFQQGP